MSSWLSIVFIGVYLLRCVYVCVSRHTLPAAVSAVRLTLQNSVVRSPERCRHALLLSPKTLGRGPSSSPGWMKDWDRSLCLEPALWRMRGSLTPASLCSVCPRLGKALGGCRGSDAVAGEGGDLRDCQHLLAGGPGWRSQCLKVQQKLWKKESGW